jgi:hypothetical protein
MRPSPRPDRRWHRLAAIALLAVAGGCDRGPSTATGGPWLPHFAQLAPSVDSIVVRRGGDVPAVRLQRKDGMWRVASRADWPAAPGRVEGLLEELAEARRLAAKTTHPDRYARLAVQPIGDSASEGVRLDIGGDPPLRLLLGRAHGETERFVRIDGDAQAWLVDKPLRASAEPDDWLDTRLVDAPLARIAHVDVRNADGHDFALEHRDDRFRVVGVPSAAMGDSPRGDALAGVLDQLQFEDVAKDEEGHVRPDRTLRFTAHDGSWLELDAWRIDGRIWVRGRDGGQGELAKAWANPALVPGHRFRLPAIQAAALMQARSQVLAK